MLTQVSISLLVMLWLKLTSYTMCKSPSSFDFLAVLGNEENGPKWKKKGGQSAYERINATVDIREHAWCGVALAVYLFVDFLLHARVYGVFGDDPCDVTVCSAL